MIIDAFSHYISRSSGEFVAKAKVFGDGQNTDFPMHYMDAESRLRHMDKYGVDIQALSQSTPVLLGFGAEEAAELCKLSNDDNYALCKAYPNRFVNICIMSLLDTESAIEELKRSINELDCRAVTLASNQNGKGLDSPEYFPFYEVMVEYDLPLFIHPTHWESYPLVDVQKGWWLMSAFGWPFDTTQAAWRLIFGGVMDRFPTMKIVMHHLGAMFPFFAGRIESILHRRLSKKLPRPISEYWKNIYGDTAVDGNLAAFPCGYAFFGPDRMLYGTDYPFGPEDGEKYMGGNLAGVKAMNIPEEEREKILGGNAKKLFKIT